MKTTLEIPDFLFRRAKSVAAERGIPLRQFVTEAVQEKLRTTSLDKPWMKHLEKLKGLDKERKQIEKPTEKATLISERGLYFMPATTYSPTHFRVQYHRPGGA